MNGIGPRIAVQSDGSGTELLGKLEEFRQALKLAAERKQVRSMSAIVRSLLWSQGIRHAWELTPQTVEQYLAGLVAGGRAPKTVMNHLSAVRVFCYFLKRRGLLSADPCADVRLRRPEERLPRYLEDEEIAEVLRLARAHHMWPEICLALSTGLRVSELIRLQWVDVDLARDCLTVRKSKSRRPRVVPLNRSALAALGAQRRITGGFTYVFPARRTWPGCLACRDPARRYLDRPRSSSWWNRAMRPIQQAVPKFCTLPGSSTGRGFHLLRHTFASRLAQAGVSLYKIAAWLGHSDVRTTHIYAHLQVGFDEEIEKARIPPRPRRKGR